MKDLSEYTTEEILVELEERGKEDTFLSNISTEEMLVELDKRGFKNQEVDLLASYTCEQLLLELAERGFYGRLQQDKTDCSEPQHYILSEIEGEKGIVVLHQVGFKG